MADWLRRSRVFVLTSESEGLSQALLQATMCGLPAIVSDVGDLRDCINHRENGFLVPELTVEAFAGYFVTLLDDKQTYEDFRKNALQSAARYQVPNVARVWDEIL